MFKPAGNLNDHAGVRLASGWRNFRGFRLTPPNWKALDDQAPNILRRGRERAIDATKDDTPDQADPTSTDKHDDQTLPAFVRRHFVRTGEKFFHRLERAREASRAQIGDQVKLSKSGAGPVTISDGAGGKRTASRNAWTIEVEGRPSLAPSAENPRTAGDHVVTVGERLSKRFSEEKLGHLPEAQREEYRERVGTELAKLRESFGVGRQHGTPDEDRRRKNAVRER